MQELEEVFGSLVVEAYCMTKAAHQIASNPLPPRARAPGAVGLAARPKIAVMTDDGTLLPQGEVEAILAAVVDLRAGSARRCRSARRCWS